MGIISSAPRGAAWRAGGLTVWSARVFAIRANYVRVERSNIFSDFCFDVAAGSLKDERVFNYSYIAHTPGETSIMLRIKLMNF